MTDPGQPVHDVRQLLSGTTRHLACGADIDELTGMLSYVLPEQPGRQLDRLI